MVKVLGILGSARRKGNSDLLLSAVLDSAAETGAETERVELAKLNIRPCLNCGGCNKTGVCIQKDEMQPLYDKLLSYDIIILASPIYFMGISAWAKTMIDRCQALWVRKYRLEKLPEVPREARKGIFLSVSGMKKEGVYDGAIKTIKSFFATIHVTYDHDQDMLFPGVDSKGEIENHPSALDQARDLGKKMVEGM